MKKKLWKPVPVAVQVKRHHAAVVAARKATHRTAAQKHAAKLRAKKAAATRKKHPAKTRKWSPDEDVALCSARAVAESLRLALGVPVSHDDVLALYWLVADDADAGATISAMLEAAQEHGIAGHRPVSFRHMDEAAAFKGMDPDEIKPLLPPVLLLAAEFPGGSHAVAAEWDRWWSWGEAHTWDEWPDACIDEAWAVTWQ